MMHYTANPVEPVELSVGDEAILGEGGQDWWRIQAVSENFAVAVRFKQGVVQGYTVLDWRNGVRGPCNLIGQGFGDGSYSEEECAEMLTGFEYTYETDPNYLEAKRAYEAGEIERLSWPSPDLDLEVSHRNWVPLEVITVKRQN